MVDEKAFSNREIVQLLKGQDDRMETFQVDVRGSLSRLEMEVEHNSGRTTSLESWRAYVVGFCACLTLLILPIVMMATKKFFGI